LIEKEVRLSWNKDCGFFLRRLIKFSLGIELFIFFCRGECCSRSRVLLCREKIA
jgi:hypothetical protein